MYSSNFKNPYPDGWDKHTQTPPINIEIMQNQTDTLQSIDAYLKANNSELLDISVDRDIAIEIKPIGHTYLILRFGSIAYDVTFIPSEEDGAKAITFQGGIPDFKRNTVYELSFLDSHCVYMERRNG